MRPLKSLLILLISTFFVTETILAQVTDIDGNTYKTVTIGDQVWMAENLKVTKFNDGSPIPLVNNDEQWGEKQKQANSAYTYSLFESQTKNKGLIYNEYVVFADKDIAPEGWRIPTGEDWKELEQYLKENFTEANLREECVKRNIGDDAEEKCSIGQSLRSTDVWTHDRESIFTWKERGTNTTGFNALQGVVYYNYPMGSRYCDKTYGDNMRCIGFEGESRSSGKTGWWSSSRYSQEQERTDYNVGGTYSWIEITMLGLEDYLDFNMHNGHYEGLFIRLIKE